MTTETTTTETTTTETGETAAPVVVTVANTEPEKTGDEMTATEVAAVAAAVVDEIEKKAEEEAKEAEQLAEIRDAKWYAEMAWNETMNINSRLYELEQALQLLASPINPAETVDADLSPAEIAADAVDNPATTILDAVKGEEPKNKTRQGWDLL